jgi:AraC-like DNA-binding protein
MVQFSTDAFSERERIAAWRESFGRGFAKLDVEPLPAISFRARMDVRIMPGLSIAYGRGTLGKATRTRELVADGSDTLVFKIVTCDGLASQFGREVPVAAGDAILLSCADVGSFTYRAPQSALAVGLPRAVLRHFLYDPDAALLRVVTRDSAALWLLTSYVRAIVREPAPPSEDLQHLAAAHVQDLIAMALGPSHEAAEIARCRGVRAARLHAAKTYVMQHLDQEGLVAAGVAAHLGVTRRYTHMLFENEGLSFSEFVLAGRLARAHEMLRAPRHASDTISTIAYAAGFADLSHFNRSFRRRYGCTPSDVRAQIRRSRDGGSA